MSKPVTAMEKTSKQKPKRTITWLDDNFFLFSESNCDQKRLDLLWLAGLASSGLQIVSFVWMAKINFILVKIVNVISYNGI